MDKFIHQKLVVAENSGDIVSQSNHTGTGEGCQVNHTVRILPSRKGQRIGKDQPALGIGIEDFNGFAVEIADNITRFLGRSAG